MLALHSITAQHTRLASITAQRQIEPATRNRQKLRRQEQTFLSSRSNNLTNLSFYSLTRLFRYVTIVKRCLFVTSPVVVSCDCGAGCRVERLAGLPGAGPGCLAADTTPPPARGLVNTVNTSHRTNNNLISRPSAPRLGGIQPSRFPQVGL